MNEIPDRATRSVRVSPCEANIWLISSSLKSGRGIWCLTLAFVETLPSSLPSSTSKDGPPV